MASLIKKNEAITAPFYKNGTTLQFFQLDFGGNVTSLLAATAAGVRSPVAIALEAVQQVCSIEIVGTVDNTGGTGEGLRFAVAAPGGAFGTSKWDGTNSETFALYLQRLIQAAAGTVRGINVAAITCTAYTF